MRLYHRSRDDQRNACRRCLFDARHGRVKLALDRVADVMHEGPLDQEVEAEIVHTEGVIRRDFLGQGFLARDLFERAYDLNPGHTFSIINATQLARNLEEFRKWTGIFRDRVPLSEDRSHRLLDSRWQSLDQGLVYWEVLQDLALIHAEGKVIGQAVSLMELTLADHQLPFDEEARKRRWRAQQLRALDDQGEHFRRAHEEYFPPDERLALQNALLELDRAIGLDEYDAEMWNLKAAWCLMLARYEEAIAAAEKAKTLRPHAYAKPDLNLGQAHWARGQDAIALASAQNALQEAEDAGDTADKQLAEQLIRQYSRPRIEPTLSDFRPSFKRFLQGVNILADIEVGEHESDHETVIFGFFNRCRKLYGSQSLAYVPIVAELLSDFSPERAYHVVSHITKMPELLSNRLLRHPMPGPTNLFKLSQDVYDHCLHAALYVAAHSEGVQQRDAARLLCLIFFGALDAKSVRSCYREAILETSAAATDEMTRLDVILREELGRIHTQLPNLIADQKPVDKAGRERATRKILSRFHPKSGCALVVIAILLVLTTMFSLT